MPKKTKFHIWNLCLFWETEDKGKYMGFIGWCDWSIAFLLPWCRNDGDRGFFEWLFFRFGWYPINEENIKWMA